MREDRRPKMIRVLHSLKSDGASTCGTREPAGPEEDFAVDEAISAALKGELRWDGSPDRMWTHIEKGLGEGSGTRRRIALAAAYAALAVSVILLFFLARSQLARRDIYVSRSFTRAEIKAETNEVLPGGSLPVSLKVSAQGGVVRIGSDMSLVQLATRGGRNLIVSEVPIMRYLTGTHIAEGDEHTEEYLITAPTEPGWYFLTLAVPMEEGGKCHVGGYHGFLVKYPEGGTHQGELAVEQEVESDGRTLTVHSVTMTDRVTEVRYSLSDEKPVAAHAVNLVTKDSESLLLLERQERVAAGWVSGVAVFEPTPATVQTLSFQVACAGPSGGRSNQRLLKLDIPLPAKGQ